MNLSPWQSWGHVFCCNTGESACTAVLECGQTDGGPVTRGVTVNLKTIFASYPGKTAEMVARLTQRQPLMERV